MPNITFVVARTDEDLFGMDDFATDEHIQKLKPIVETVLNNNAKEQITFDEIVKEADAEELDLWIGIEVETEENNPHVWVYVDFMDEGKEVKRYSNSMPLNSIGEDSIQLMDELHDIIQGDDKKGTIKEIYEKAKAQPIEQLWKDYFHALIEKYGAAYVNELWPYNKAIFDELSKYFVVDDKDNKIYVSWPGWKKELVYDVNRGFTESSLKILTKYLQMMRLTMWERYHPTDFVSRGKYRVDIVDEYVDETPLGHIVVQSYEDDKAWEEASKAEEEGELMVIIATPICTYVWAMKDGRHMNYMGKTILSKEQLLRLRLRVNNEKNNAHIDTTIIQEARSNLEKKEDKKQSGKGRGLK